MRLNQRKAGIFLNYIYEGIRVLTMLVYTPVILRLLGSSEYGLYQLVSSTVAYLSLLELGFGGAYVRYHSRYYVNEDEDGIARLNGMFMIVFSVMAGIALTSGLIMTFGAGVLFADGLTASELEQAKVMMAILVGGMVLTFPNTVFSCYVSAHERFVFQKLLNVVQSLLNPCLTLPLLLLGYGSVAVVAISAGLTAVTLAVNAFYCFKRLKMRFSFRNLQLSVLKEMGAFTFFIFLNEIIDQVNWSVDTFLLGRVYGTAIVTTYGIGAQVNALYRQISTSVASVFAPRVNRIVARTDDNRSLTQMMIRVGRVQFLILALVLSGFLFFGKEFIRLWAGEGFEHSYLVALILIVPLTIPLIQNLGIEIQRAKNKHRVRSVVYACFAVFNVAISMFLLRKWGAVGAAIGTSVSLLLGNVVFMNWYYHKRIGLDMIAFWKAIIQFVPALLIPVVFGGVYTHFVHVVGWRSLMLAAVVYTCVYVLSMWLFGMNDYEKELVISTVRMITRRGRKHD